MHDHPDGINALEFSWAQDATGLVTTGRAYLSGHDLANANSSFRTAVAAAPNDETANALYAYIAQNFTSVQAIAGTRFGKP